MDEAIAPTRLPKPANLPRVVQLGLIGLLVALATLAWIVTGDRMHGMDAGPGTDLGELGWFVGVWVVMMAAMMFPSILPIDPAVRTGLSPPDGVSSHTLKRTHLYGAIHEEATDRGIAIEHGKRLVDVEQISDGVRAVFEDGSDAIGDVLIGADGIHSVVRRLIDPAAPAPTYGGLINLGGYTRGVQVDAEPGSYKMIFGKRAFFGYALAPGDEVWWFANVPRGDEPARGEVEAITADAWQEQLTALYADDAGPAVRLVRASDPVDIMRASPTHAIPHLPVWHTGRMIVIGDAAHAPTPTSGQGASLAVEDAVVLAKCLRDVSDPQQALARFEALRRPGVERIIKQAARINSNKAAGPVARTLRDAVLPVILRMATNSKRLAELYAYHIDWDTPTDSVNA